MEAKSARLALHKYCHNTDGKQKSQSPCGSEIVLTADIEQIKSESERLLTRVQNLRKQNKAMACELKRERNEAKSSKSNKPSTPAHLKRRQTRALKIHKERLGKQTKPVRNLQLNEVTKPKRKDASAFKQKDNASFNLNTSVQHEFKPSINEEYANDSAVESVLKELRNAESITSLHTVIGSMQTQTNDLLQTLPQMTSAVANMKSDTERAAIGLQERIQSLVKSYREMNEIAVRAPLAYVHDMEYLDNDCFNVEKPRKNAPKWVPKIPSFDYEVVYAELNDISARKSKVDSLLQSMKLEPLESKSVNMDTVFESSYERINLSKPNEVSQRVHRRLNQIGDEISEYVEKVNRHERFIKEAQSVDVESKNIARKRQRLPHTGHVRSREKSHFAPWMNPSKDWRWELERVQLSKPPRTPKYLRKSKNEAEKLTETPRYDIDKEDEENVSYRSNISFEKQRGKREPTNRRKEKKHNNFEHKKNLQKKNTKDKTGFKRKPSNPSLRVTMPHEENSSECDDVKSASSMDHFLREVDSLLVSKKTDMQPKRTPEYEVIMNPSISYSTKVTTYSNEKINATTKTKEISEEKIVGISEENIVEGSPSIGLHDSVPLSPILKPLRTDIGHEICTRLITVLGENVGNVRRCATQCSLRAIASLLAQSIWSDSDNIKTSSIIAQLVHVAEAVYMQASLIYVDAAANIIAEGLVQSLSLDGVHKRELNTTTHPMMKQFIYSLLEEQRFFSGLETTELISIVCVAYTRILEASLNSQERSALVTVILKSLENKKKYGSSMYATIRACCEASASIFASHKHYGNMSQVVRTAVRTCTGIFLGTFGRSMHCALQACVIATAFQQAYGKQMEESIMTLVQSIIGKEFQQHGSSLSFYENSSLRAALVSTTELLKKIESGQAIHSKKVQKEEFLGDGTLLKIFQEQQQHTMNTVKNSNFTFTDSMMNRFEEVLGYKPSEMVKDVLMKCIPALIAIVQIEPPLCLISRENKSQSVSICFRVVDKMCELAYTGFQTDNGRDPVKTCEDLVESVQIVLSNDDQNCHSQSEQAQVVVADEEPKFQQKPHHIHLKSAEPMSAHPPETARKVQNEQTVMNYVTSAVMAEVFACQDFRSFGLEDVNVDENKDSSNEGDIENELISNTASGQFYDQSSKSENIGRGKDVFEMLKNDSSTWSDENILDLVTRMYLDSVTGGDMQIQTKTEEADNKIGTTVPFEIDPSVNALSSKISSAHQDIAVQVELDVDFDEEGLQFRDKEIRLNEKEDQLKLRESQLNQLLLESKDQQIEILQRDKEQRLKWESDILSSFMAKISGQGLTTSKSNEDVANDMNSGSNSDTAVGDPRHSSNGVIGGGMPQKILADSSATIESVQDVDARNISNIESGDLTDNIHARSGTNTEPRLKEKDDETHSVESKDKEHTDSLIDAENKNNYNPNTALHEMVKNVNELNEEIKTMKMQRASSAGVLPQEDSASKNIESLKEELRSVRDILENLKEKNDFPHPKEERDIESKNIVEMIRQETRNAIATFKVVHGHQNHQDLNIGNDNNAKNELIMNVESKSNEYTSKTRTMLDWDDDSADLEDEASSAITFDDSRDLSEGEIDVSPGDVSDGEQIYYPLPPNLLMGMGNSDFFLPTAQEIEKVESEILKSRRLKPSDFPEDSDISTSSYDEH